MSLGIVKALTRVGRVRDAILRAVELDPQLYAARNAPVQFYLVVPGVAGGSVARRASARQPEHAKWLLALVAVAQKDYGRQRAGWPRFGRVPTRNLRRTGLRSGPNSLHLPE